MQALLPTPHHHLVAKRGRQRMGYQAAVDMAVIANSQANGRSGMHNHRGMKRNRQLNPSDVPQSTNANNHPRPIRQKTVHHPNQQRINLPPDQQPQAQTKPNSEKPQQPVAPATSTAPESTAASIPKRGDHLIGFFSSAPSTSATSVPRPGFSYTLGIHATGGDRTQGDWELYEDYDSSKLPTIGDPRNQTRNAVTATRRRTTWSGRWTLQPERDNFGWVRLIKTSEVVQENGKSTARQCRMVQCCPYNLTTDSKTGEAKIGIMLNAFDHNGGLFLTRALC